MSFSKQMEQRFVLEEIGQTITLDSSQLVREIKNYPIIYDNNSRRDQTSIFLAWESVCTKMIPSFPSMSENDKIATRKRLKDRWSYMRSTFRRDIMNDNIYCHHHLEWIQELNFLVPILTRTAATSKTMKKNGKYKSSFNKKKTNPHKTTSTITSTTTTTTSNTNNKSLQSSSSTSETAVITENSEIVAVSTTTESSICDTVISCDSSSSSENSSTISLDLIKSNPMQTTTPSDEQSHNDLLVQTFMSTFNSEYVLASIVDPDQIFLLTLLQNYRLVRSDKKEALQHKFYTFLRD